MFLKQFKKEFIELTNDSFVKDDFHTCNIKDFRLKCNVAIYR